MGKFAVKFRKLVEVEAIIEADTEQGAEELIYRGDCQHRCLNYSEEEIETEVLEISDIGVLAPSIFDIEEDKEEYYY